MCSIGSGRRDGCDGGRCLTPLPPWGEVPATSTAADLPFLNLGDGACRGCVDGRCAFGRPTSPPLRGPLRSSRQAGSPATRYTQTSGSPDPPAAAVLGGASTAGQRRTSRRRGHVGAYPSAGSFIDVRRLISFAAPSVLRTPGSSVCGAPCATPLRRRSAELFADQGSRLFEVLCFFQVDLRPHARRIERLGAVPDGEGHAQQLAPKDDEGLRGCEALGPD